MEGFGSGLVFLGGPVVSTRLPLFSGLSLDELACSLEEREGGTTSEDVDSGINCGDGTVSACRRGA